VKKLATPRSKGGQIEILPWQHGKNRAMIVILGAIAELQGKRVD
jgi:hypothetical protein